MSAAARKALEKLLSRAERAWSRNSEDATLALRMSAASFKDYLELPTRRDTDEFHAAMRAAERAGAIRIEWDSRAGEDGQILRVVLMDRAALTNHLGRTPLWDACSQAAARLSEFAPHEGARRLLEKWQIGKRPRGIGPDRVDDLVDAVRVLHGLDEYSGEDIPVRQYSVKLFNDSKRIETLLPVLDFLTSEEDDEGMARTAEEILGGLGLIRHPQPALAAGMARVVFTNGDAIRIPSPYLGLAPQSVECIEVDPRARFILTVENYTTFSEICRGKAGPIQGVVLYTAGMPSPSFLTVYAKALESTPAGIPVYHWGDIDLGGYRIAEVLSSQALAMGKNLLLWNMNPEDISRNHTPWRSLSDKEVGWMKQIAERNQWLHEYIGIDSASVAFEQEMLKPALPDGHWQKYP